MAYSAHLWKYNSAKLLIYQIYIASECVIGIQIFYSRFECEWAFDWASR